jgi:hypothetical protein
MVYMVTAYFAKCSWLNVFSVQVPPEGAPVQAQEPVHAFVAVVMVQQSARRVQAA